MDFLHQRIFDPILGCGRPFKPAPTQLITRLLIFYTGNDFKHLFAILFRVLDSHNLLPVFLFILNVPPVGPSSQLAITSSVVARCDPGELKRGSD
jgi:hypothetical protein